MRVLFLTKYPRRGPSSRYRVLQYIPYLEREGFLCEQHSLHAEGYLGALYAGGRGSRLYHARRILDRTLVVFGATRYDAVFIQKELVPYSPPLLEALLRIYRSRVIYDIDDAIFLFYERSGHPLVRWMLGSKIPTVLRWSGAVLAGNRHLAGYAARFNGNTRYFPTVLDLGRYPSSGLSHAGERGSAVIGWIGSPETVDFLHEREAALRRLHSRHPFTLRVIGATGSGGGGFDVEEVPWREETEVEELMKCDIGIMPLSDDEWAKGKCGLKLLQYMACGLPVVSSPGGGAGEIITDGREGFIARSDREWEERLGELLTDRGLRERMGSAGRERVERSFSLDVWAPRMARVLKSVIAGEPVPGGEW